MKVFAQWDTFSSDFTRHFNFVQKFICDHLQGVLWPGLKKPQEACKYKSLSGTRRTIAETVRFGDLLYTCFENVLTASTLAGEYEDKTEVLKVESSKSKFTFPKLTTSYWRNCYIFLRQKWPQGAVKKKSNQPIRACSSPEHTIVHILASRSNNNQAKANHDLASWLTHAFPRLT